MKFTHFVIFLTAIVLASPFTVSAKEKTKPKISSKETTKLNDLTMGMTKCAQIGIPLVRLRCFDELAGTQATNKPKSAEPANNINGKWDVSVKPDPVDDIKKVTLTLKAEDERVWVVIRCKNNNTEFFINWDTPLEEYEDIYGNKKTYVLTRIGKEDAIKATWQLSTDRQATFHPDGSPISFIKKLMLTDKYLAQVTRSYNPNPFTATFDIKGLDNAIKPLAETCHWDN